MSEVYYFAYGSNLLPLRLLERVPSSRPLVPLTLPEHRLCWHKRGGDGSGKCDALYTGDPADRLPGFVYRLAASEQIKLDRAEGLGFGYRLAYYETGALPIFFYQAEPQHTDPELTPFDWYHALVVAGAEHHRLPADHIAALRRTATIADPDGDRAAQHQDILRRAQDDSAATIAAKNGPSKHE